MGLPSSFTSRVAVTVAPRPTEAMASSWLAPRMAARLGAVMSFSRGVMKSRTGTSVLIRVTR